MSKRFTMLLGGGLLLLLSFTRVGNATAQTCVQPPAGLVSWWPGDGNADDLAGTNDGVLQNGATFAPGHVGQAFSFDGTDDYVNVGSNVNLANSSFTVEVWAKRASSDTNDVILGQGVADTNHSLHIGFRDNGNFFCAFYFNDLEVGGLSDSDWHHWACTYNVSTGARILYRDGVVVGQEPSGVSPYEGTGPLAIGAHLFNDGTISSHFHGLVDELGIYNRALSDAEIKAIFDAGSAGKCEPRAFASFAAVTTFALGPQADDDAFAMQATFTLGNDSTGIAPLTDPVHLHVGALSLTIPAGSFQRAAHHGAFVFAGVLDGVQVRSTVLPPKGNGKKSQTYQFKASGTGANLSGTEIPVNVRLVVGDDGGSTTLTEVTAQSPQ